MRRTVRSFSFFGDVLLFGSLSLSGASDCQEALTTRYPLPGASHFCELRSIVSFSLFRASLTVGAPSSHSRELLIVWEASHCWEASHGQELLTFEIFSIFWGVLLLGGFSLSGAYHGQEVLTTLGISATRVVVGRIGGSLSLS